MRQTEGGHRETVLEDGYNPSISADQSTLVYISNTRAGQMLMKKAIDQPGDRCELLSDQVFQYLSQQRISLDGQRLALGGSGQAKPSASSCGTNHADEPAASVGSPGDERAVAAVLPGALELGEWLDVLPTTAYAHGSPADVYSPSLDGSGLQRIADIKDDDPTVAWSPDGSRLAIFGVSALYVVDSHGGPPTKLVDQGYYGGLDWTR